MLFVFGRSAISRRWREKLFYTLFITHRSRMGEGSFRYFSGGKKKPERANHEEASLFSIAKPCKGEPCIEWEQNRTMVLAQGKARGGAGTMESMLREDWDPRENGEGRWKKRSRPVPQE